MGSKLAMVSRKTVSNSLPIHRRNLKMRREHEKSEVQQSRHSKNLFCVDGERNPKFASTLRLLSPQPKSPAERRRQPGRGGTPRRRVAPAVLCPNAEQDKRERREEKAEEAEKKGRDGGSRAARPRRQGRRRGGGRGTVLQRLASAARVRGEGGAEGHPRR